MKTMKTMKTIKDICTKITTGVTGALLDKNAQESSESCLMLSGNSINRSGEIIKEKLTSVHIKGDKDVSRFKVESGDVVILARGNSMRAAYVTSTISNLNVLTSGNFILLRPDSNILIGEVLVTYLNSTQGQSALSRASAGVAIRNISLANLKNIQIDLPSLQKQKEIAELFHASNQAYSSTIEMAEQQRNVTDACINQLMKDAA